jgi:hypothetical protein
MPNRGVHEGPMRCVTTIPVESASIWIWNSKCYFTRYRGQQTQFKRQTRLK